ncbi:hypothetical protein BRADI_5g25422v3 [Brachypodium distachyon]|uniref:Uncharacterized protein n=1 Tax=Brachypodium distachyon TaxID=15368 RepID=A0A2K2CJ89_BRADI|nr:hypothetical protein BRADI_5g25422v3 [Brachypodium distachyon]
MTPIPFCLGKATERPASSLQEKKKLAGRTVGRRGSLASPGPW